MGYFNNHGKYIFCVVVDYLTVSDEKQLGVFVPLGMRTGPSESCVFACVDMYTSPCLALNILNERFLRSHAIESQQ